MNPSGLYRIDGNDWYDTYGFVVESGKDDFLKPPGTKPRFSKDWPDEDGTEYDTSAPKLKAKAITIVGSIVGTSTDDYWDKYDAMFSLLVAEGLRKVFVNDLNRFFDLLYDEVTAVEGLTNITTAEGQEVSCRFTINFIQPSPFASSAPVGGLPYTLPFILS